ncbi:MAG: baseplate J/gp47 family protein [Clostridium sp.]|uniref:baseplate J/gp47 family protein n=1 Tax=Clostridium sp. TaxID=1506 RepID=UPI00290C8673|nr:baseplate J/gp47 family protein [Clostridium sp.]MDU7338448.1 baseplate J/gp47 family protein [Clostridium sp.]
MESYDSVLKRMQSSFEGLAGFSADDASDLGIRIKVLAGEVYSLLCGIEWLKKQIFPQTAQGEYLEMHAAQRGLTRKSAVPSSGTLVFGRSSTLPYDVLIPKGTVCSVSGENSLRFETTKEVTLTAGSRTVQVPAVAQQGGKPTNTAANTVTLLLTPPAGIESVYNPSAFTGGTDEESDEELCKRLQKSYEVLPNGTNAEFYRSFVVQYDGIQSASVVPRAQGTGTVAIYAAGRGAAPSAELLFNIQAELNRLREINVIVTVFAAQLVAFPISLYIDPAPGCTLAAATAQAIHEMESYFEQLSVGESVILAQIGKRLMDTGLIRNYRFDDTLTKDKKMELSQLAVPDPIYVQQMGSVV